MFRETPTPIEVYVVKGRRVFVKRDDLYAAPPAPPVAKLRGLRMLFDRLRSEGRELVGCFEARVSSIGQGVAALCAEGRGMSCIIGYPSVPGRGLTQSLHTAKELGGELLPVKSNYVSICHAQARRVVEERGGYMIPFGFECAEAISAVESEASTVPVEYLREGTCVLCCGSGVTLTGILRGFRASPSHIVGVSSGRSVKRIRNCISRHVSSSRVHVELHDCILPYNEAAKSECPFPCNPYYDLKAWVHLVRHLHLYEDPVLFWNIGS